MGDSADLQATIAQLIESVKALQETAEANSKAILAIVGDKSSSSSSMPGSGTSNTDRPPPRFQKLDFPKYAG
jgi:hypothetical protein